MIDVLGDEAVDMHNEVVAVARQARDPTSRTFGNWFDLRVSSPPREGDSDDAMRDLASVLLISSEKPIGSGVPTGSNGRLGGIQVGS